ncbi:hypothetical protein LSH36_2g16050 [Paralvinella palmiformis]|uniref:VPS37 C-terminal domain-containing protein n=1 Tax=Paralvinella palmiformis TaxID=53620 RepID=A0AAD9KFY3_9ANNE|nr:hypothetical protein LSH36_2g16050 [Paralvinella palmiformis]
MHLVFQADKDVSAQDTEQDVEDYWKIVLQLKSVEGISCNPSLQVVVKAGFILAQTNAESDRSLSINTGVFTKDRRLLGELTIIDLHAGKQAVCFHDPADHNHRTFPVTKDLKLSVSVSEIQRDVEYRVNTVVNGSTISLLISLPPNFPQDKPLVKVSPRVAHSWINDQMIVVGSHGLNNVRINIFLCNSFLEGLSILVSFNGYGARPFGTCPTVTSTGGPSQPILQPSGFRFQPQTNQQQANIPSYITSIPVSLQHISVVSGIPPATISSQSGKGDPHSLDGDVQGQLKFGGGKIPELPETLKSQLQHLRHVLVFAKCNEKLQELLDDEDKVLLHLRCLPDVEQLTRNQEHYIEVNEQLARSNLSLKPVLEEKKKLLLEKVDLIVPGLISIFISHLSLDYQ